MTLGDRLKKFRKQKGYSQEKLAEIVKISKMSIRRYEANERIPSFDTLNKIAKALDTTPLMLYEGANRIKELERIAQNMPYTIQPGEIEHDLLNTFWMLNENGGQIALERLKELTEIARYTEYQSEDE